jgi:hypothetical protein
MMQTSVRMLSFKRDGGGVFAVAIQIDVVACESSLMLNCQLPIADFQLSIRSQQNEIGNHVTSPVFRC